MFHRSILALAFLIVAVHSRPRYWVFREEEGELTPQYVIEDPNLSDNEETYTPRHIGIQDEEVLALEQTFEDQSPRQKRQIQKTVHPDQTVDLSGSKVLAKTDTDAVAAFGSITGVKSGQFDRATAGLAYENANGHGLTAAASHTPTFGNDITAAGKLNLLNTPAHKLDANAFASRTFPNTPQIPNFNTYGGSLDYSYRDKIGASLGAKTIPAFDRTDLSAMGKVNIFKTPTSSFDFGAGYGRTYTPNFSFGSPRFDMTYRRSF